MNDVDSIEFVDAHLSPLIWKFLLHLYLLLESHQRGAGGGQECQDARRVPSYYLLSCGSIRNILIIKILKFLKF